MFVKGGLFEREPVGEGRGKQSDGEEYYRSTLYIHVHENSPRIIHKKLLTRRGVRKGS
jgi:hypothetical protein